MRIQIISFALLFAAAGCECLPAGDPPKGAIVNSDTAPAQPLSEEAAINFMTTEFGMIAVEKMEAGSAVGIRGNAPRQAFEVVNRSASFIRLKPTMEEEPLMIHSNIDGGGTWTFELFDSGKRIFSANSKIRTQL